MQTVYVTGADRGLGLALTKALLEQGCRVFAGSFLPDWPELAEVKESAGERLTVLPLDVTNEESVNQAAETIRQQTAALDVVINNAGIYRDRSGTVLDELNFEDMQRIYNTNALGPLRVTHSVIQLLLQGSRKLLVNISSEAGSVSQCFRKSEFGYTMSKAALNMQSVLLSNHLKPMGVKVLAVHPGYVRSYMLGKFNEEGTVEAKESAQGICQLIETQTDLDGPIYMDFRGKPMNW